MTDVNSRDMQIAEAVQKATVDSFYGREVPSLAAIIASVPGDEPVAWEYRTHYETNMVVPGWGEWKRVVPSHAGFTVLDAVNDLKQYIAHGYKYELRALYTGPQPVCATEPAPELTDAELLKCLESVTHDVARLPSGFAKFARAVITADRAKRGTK